MNPNSTPDSARRPDVPPTEPERTTLQGNTFITIPQGTIVMTDDPLFPYVRLQEDVKVCSNAKAKVMKV